MSKTDADILGYRNEQRIHHGRMHRLDDYLTDLERHGYRMYYQGMDFDISLRAECQDCGHIGMKYIGMKGMTYVAIMQCPECHYWTEF